MSDPKIILALDNINFNECIHLAKRLNPKQCRLKIGLELFTRYGPTIVESLQNLGYEIFLDLKYHDIPYQVANACITAANLGVWMCTLHALGGKDMLEFAANSIANFKSKPKLVAVTILTSFNDLSCKQIGLQENIDNNVISLTKLAKNCGMDGIVCSAREAKKIRNKYSSENFILVTPGIRMPSDASDDQKRIETPVEAIKNGSSYLVIGRSITTSKDPYLSLNNIIQSIHEKKLCQK